MSGRTDMMQEFRELPLPPELGELLEGLLGVPQAELRHARREALQGRRGSVFRFHFCRDDRTRAVVAKRLKPEAARRTELLVRRWLPALGMNENGPPLLGSVAERSGEFVWHVYEDLGRCELDACQPDPKKVRAAVDLIARLHTRFAEHPLLGEVRLAGGDRGIHYYETNVRDALRALEACRSGKRNRHLRERMLRRLSQLSRELPLRARIMADLGGPETLLHGDLWTINVFVLPAAGGGLHVRLIDWDRAAVGPAGYDLSTFLLRFPLRDRSWILNGYQREMMRAGRRLPPVEELNLLFETAEYARFANRVIWAAVALVQDRAPWGWDELSEVNGWFENLAPVLPSGHEELEARCVSP